MATEPDATRETDAGIEMIPEYETDLLVANLSTVRGILLFSILSTIPNIFWIIWFGDNKVRELMKPAIRGVS